jgi:isopentenyl diphosphate isomerase/L-lactate dehydrogenase-like FMN-dependent dehydrogenase
MATVANTVDRPTDQPLLSVRELEAAAKAVLPQPVYDYFAGGTEDEVTIAANEQAFRRWRFRYRVLAGSHPPDTRCSILGREYPTPVFLAPTATQRLAHPDGEMAAARAAANAGVVYCLSTLASSSIEEVAAASRGQKWLQLYVLKDRSITEDLVARASSSGYGAVVVTVDSPVPTRRWRDMRNGFALPQHVEYRNLAGSLAKAGSAPFGGSALARAFGELMDPSLTWQDLEWLVRISPVPVFVKGVVRSDDAVRAVSSGAAGIIVSNHGGRELDCSIATLDALPDVVQAVGASTPVLMDGGVRRGTDVLKAVCLGATAVLIGRPFLWALAVGGEEGVAQLLRQMSDEITTSMSLLGAASLSDLTRDLLSAAS